MCRAHAAGQGGLTSELIKHVGGKDVLVSVLSHKPGPKLPLSSGEDHWQVARVKRVYDTRISRTESLWVQNMGPRLTHEGHATMNVSGVCFQGTCAGIEGRPKGPQAAGGGR